MAKRLMISISNGQVIDAVGLPEPYDVEVRDYDVEHIDDKWTLLVDAAGDPYQSYTFSASPAGGGSSL